jgi:hypothetical protein
MRRALRKILLILFDIALVSSAMFSENKFEKHYSWGSIQTVREGSNVVTMRLHLQPLESGTKQTVLSRRVLYYALSPAGEIRCTIQNFAAAVNSLINVYRPMPGISSHDSTIVDQTLEPVPFQELPFTPKAAVTGYGWFRGYYVARIEIMPFYVSESKHQVSFAQNINVQLKTVEMKASNVPEREGVLDPLFDTVLRELIVNYKEARRYEMPSVSDTTGGWFKTASKYIKLAIGDDGIYRITRTQLAALYPSVVSVDPTTFQMYDRGKEIPIFVSGESDGIFDDNDYIEFPALRNYTGKHRIITTGLTDEYNEYLNRYTDTTFLWLTWGTAKGTRVAPNPTAIPTSDTLGSYTAFAHLESQGPYPGLQTSWADIYSQQDYRWNSHDLWPWNFLNANGAATASFVPSDIDFRGDSVAVYAKIASWGASVISAAHNIAIRLNGGLDLNTAILNRGDQSILSGRVPASSLTAGANSISLYSYPTASSPNNIIYDWFEVEYPRQLKVVNDTILFDFRSLPDRKLRNVQITGLQSTAIIIYKVKPIPERIVNYSLSGAAPYTLVFADTIGPQEQYVVLPSSSAYAPVFKTIKIFANIRSNKSQADYIAITRSKFYPEAVQYVQNIETSKHLKTRLFEVDDIFDEFAFGYPTSEAIQTFVKSSFQWSIPSPSYLVLFGDASYDYKYYFKHTTAINYVPSFGYPVSDVAYASVDTVTNLPQMYVGRIPVNNVGELTQYKSTFTSYISTQFDDWNKRFLFFTGGDPANPGQIALLNSVHDEIVATMAKPAPIGGLTTHFYKTVSPQSDFGPFSIQEIRDAISTGGVFISYIGHSGTQTWDNSIGDPLQLKNARERPSLITDFGCSTGKFAEPLLKSFSELFVVGPTASAIAYIGNTSLGFQGIATSLPQKFYSALLKDSIVRIGKAHLISKMRKVLREGFSTENGVMLYNNTLIGDPTVDLKIPYLPNLIAQQNLISYPRSDLTDDQDSAGVSIVYGNYGSVTSDSIDIEIQQSFLSELVRSWSIRRPMPLTYDTLYCYGYIKHRAGEHHVTITLDPHNKVAELTKNDNSATNTFLVSSTDFKIVSPTPMSISSVSSMVLLNPESEHYDPGKIVSIEIDTLRDYSTAGKLNAPMGVVTTSFNIVSLRRPARYYWRANIQGGASKWTTGTFYLGALDNSSFGQFDSLSKTINAYTNTEIVRDSVSLSKIGTSMRAISSGTYDGWFGVIEINGLNKIPDSFAGGHNIIVLDTLSFDVVKFGNFDMYEHPAENRQDSMISFINSTPSGMLVASVIIHEGSVGFTSSGRTAYKSIGASSLIDSLGFRDSYSIIGRKGAPTGTALENFKRSTTGKAIVETTFVRKATTGSFVTPEIGPATAWYNLQVEKTEPSNSSAKTSFLGVRKNGVVDTLISSTLSSSVSLTNISSAVYPFGRMVFDLTAGPSLASPAIKSWSIKAQSPPELVLSKNTVHMQKSVMQEGEATNVGVEVFNVGSSKADSVLISILTDDSGPPRTLKSVVVPTFNAGDTVSVLTQYDSRGRRGNHSFVFQVDPNNVISELYKSNNTVSVPYTVLPDTIRPSLDITFDNMRVLDGDYVRAVPLVLFTLRDINGMPLTQSDTSNVRIELNGKPVFYTGNANIQFTLRTAPVLAEIQWTPQLQEGENAIKYFAKDAAANSSDTTFLTVKVASKLELYNVYNIPNPFGTGTTFTFTLTGSDDPQNAHIKIYTVAGRLIQDLDFSSKVRIGMNGYQNSSDNLYWNGRDKDGSEIANGIYLYRVVISGGGQQTTATQKLVKMR